jgi:competence protein ComGC
MGGWNKWCRKALVLVLIIIVLMISVFLIVYMKTIEDEIPNDEECADLGVNGDLKVEQAEIEYTDQDETYCWCKRQSYSDLQNDSDINSYCDEYISD